MNGDDHQVNQSTVSIILKSEINPDNTILNTEDDEATKLLLQHNLSNPLSLGEEGELRDEHGVGSITTGMKMPTIDLTIPDPRIID
jgi:hypothetical protein